MLSNFQKEKLQRFFNILDWDRNGVIEEDDFIAIAENLCILWDIKEDTAEYAKVMDRFTQGWKRFNFYISNNEKHANWDHLVAFADKYIVNSDLDDFNALVGDFAGEIFDNFDTNNDGYISIDEFIDLFVAYRIEVRYAAKAFRSIDQNGDEQISRAELVNAVKEFFRSDNPDAPGNALFGL